MIESYDIVIAKRGCVSFQGLTAYEGSHLRPNEIEVVHTSQEGATNLGIRPLCPLAVTQNVEIKTCLISQDSHQNFAAGPVSCPLCYPIIF